MEFFLQDSRQQQLSRWLEEKFCQPVNKLISMNGDAGFRRYFRFQFENNSYIAVDSPKEKCNNQAFAQIQQRFSTVSLPVPKIIHYCQEQGFFCLSDLGDKLLADSLTDQNMASYYQQAIDYLPTISALPSENLPRYTSDFVQLELDIFTEWLLGEHLNITLLEQEQQKLAQCFQVLINNVIEQPQVFMHRDYHSRNLMWSNEQLAIIDFQDAVVGPITYDVVSLLRDCYIKWPEKNVAELFDYFQKIFTQKTEYKNISQETWQRWFDLMGLQRHIKASGIFARLYHRDNKNGYLNDIPLTLSYIVDVAAKYPELNFLGQLVNDQVIPALNELAQKDVHS